MKSRSCEINESSVAMVNVIVDPLSDHVGYHILHWIISQSGEWYSRVNENIKDNLRSLESGVAVIDDILTPKEEETPYENQQNVEVDNSLNLNGNIQRDNSDNHINIINQIIDMNINYNDQSEILGNSRPGTQFHENSVSRLKISYHNSHSHGLSRLAQRLKMKILFPNSPKSLISIFFSELCKKWTILNSLLNDGYVESLF